MFEVRITLEAWKPNEHSAIDFAATVTTSLRQAGVRGNVEVYDIAGDKVIWNARLDHPA